jgi:hypothetical protein
MNRNKKERQDGKPFSLLPFIFEYRKWYQFFLNYINITCAKTPFMI